MAHTWINTHTHTPHTPHTGLSAKWGHVHRFRGDGLGGLYGPPAAEAETLEKLYWIGVPDVVLLMRRVYCGGWHLKKFQV